MGGITSNVLIVFSEMGLMTQIYPMVVLVPDLNRMVGINEKKFTKER